MGRELPLVVVLLVDKPFGDSCGKAAVADQYTYYHAPEPFFFFHYNTISFLFDGWGSYTSDARESGMMQNMIMV